MNPPKSVTGYFPDPQELEKKIHQKKEMSNSFVGVALLDVVEGYLRSVLPLCWPQSNPRPQTANMNPLCVAIFGKAPLWTCVSGILCAILPENISNLQKWLIWLGSIHSMERYKQWDICNSFSKVQKFNWNDAQSEKIIGLAVSVLKSAQWMKV